MRIGVRAHDYGRLGIAELAEKIKAEGLNAAQVAPPKAFQNVESVQSLTEKQAEEIGTAFADADVKISVLGCYMDLGNPDADIRNAAIENIKKCFSLGKRMGVHCVGTETAYKRLTSEEKKIWYPHMMDAIQRVLEEAVKQDVIFALEPVRHYPMDSLETTKKILEEINGGKYLRLIFDPLNVLTPENIENQDPFWETWLKEVGDYIDVLHIKDLLLSEDGSYMEDGFLGKGLLRYDVIREWLLKEEQRRKENGMAEIALLREGMHPEKTGGDLEFLQWLQGKCCKNT